MNFCFKKDTNNFIFEHLALENLKILYVGGNGITSLEKFKNFNNLEEIWLTGNKKEGVLEDITQIQYLKSNKNMKKIVLKDNNIKNIGELVKYKDDFQELELLDLRGNNIYKETIEKLGKINILEEKDSLNRVKVIFNNFPLLLRLK